MNPSKGINVIRDSVISQEDQINEINTIVKCTIAPSKIHGVGIFALEDIKKGQPLYLDRIPKVYSVSYGNFDKFFPHVKKTILDRWGGVVNGSRFLVPDLRLLSFVNHSEKPNYNPNNDTALKNIKAGDEITENYKEMTNWDKVYDWLK